MTFNQEKFTKIWKWIMLAAGIAGLVAYALQDQAAHAFGIGVVTGLLFLILSAFENKQT